MDKFHTYKCKAYPHERLNSSKGVIRSQELGLATEEETNTALRKQGFIEHKRITIKRNGENILTNTYILTFNSPTIPKQIKIGFTIEKVEPYVPAPLRCFKCQKFGHHKDLCRGQQVCGKCGEKDPSHSEDECQNDKECANCHGNHPAYSRTCDVYRREAEILHVKHQKGISFPEARKIVESYMGTRSYASVTQRINKINPPEKKNQENKYLELINKLLSLSASEWPSFQEQLKNAYREAQEETKSESQSKQTEPGFEPNSSVSRQKAKPHRSPIHPPRPLEDASEDSAPTSEMSKGKKEIRDDQSTQNSKTPANLTPTEKVSGQSKDPSAPVELKNRYKLLERMEIEEPNLTKVKAKKSLKNPP